MVTFRAPYFQTIEQAQQWREQLRQQGRRLVFTNGVFDLLHVGHARYLTEARELGDVLIVALNSDESVRSLKGPKRPLNTLEKRAEMLASLRAVDGVIGFEGDRCDELIAQLAPDVYAKGGDYTPESLNKQEKAALDTVGAEIHILSLVQGESTSNLVKQINQETANQGALRLGVLGSGSGSNFAALLQAIEKESLNAEVALVISDVADAGILAKAEQAGIPHVHVCPGSSKTRLDHAAQKEIRDRLLAAGVELVVLAGFMRLVKPPLLDEFAGKMVNIHPSLLPDFPGLMSWKQAVDAGVSQTGCTVHLVDAGMDTGPILAQKTVAVESNDTAESLHARIQQAEHQLLPQTVQLWGQHLRKHQYNWQQAITNWTLTKSKLAD